MLIQYCSLLTRTVFIGEQREQWLANHKDSNYKQARYNTFVTSDRRGSDNRGSSVRYILNPITALSRSLDKSNLPLAYNSLMTLSILAI